MVSSYICSSSLPEAYMVAVNLKDNQEFRYAHNYDDDGNNIFRIASMTKLLTSIAGIQLLDAGKVSLDESLNKILPEMTSIPILDDAGRTYHSKQPITLRHLLTNTAGLPILFFQKESGSSNKKKLPCQPFNMNYLCPKTQDYLKQAQTLLMA